MGKELLLGRGLQWGGFPWPTTQGHEKPEYSPANRPTGGKNWKESPWAIAQICRYAWEPRTGKNGISPRKCYSEKVPTITALYAHSRAQGCFFAVKEKAGSGGQIF